VCRHGGLSKAGEHAKFPLVLSMAPFVVPQQQEEQQYVYRLYGLSVHQGGIGGGHYIARVYAHTQRRWYHYSDSSGREVSLNEVLGSEAYVLFYERVPAAHAATTDSPSP
jgi:ubiquitin carboxyl-terminal hydrolase 16/45